MRRLFLFSLLFLFFYSSSSSRSSSESHIFIYGGCSPEKYTPNTPFESNRDTFLSSVVTSSSDASFNSFAVGNDSSSSSSSSAVFGLYQCRDDLRSSDCSKCIQTSVDQITLICPYSYGASLQLEGCFLRYETNDFLGKPDTSLRYKKCSSKSVENDYDFFKRRDDVLSDLESTQLGYKVSRSGLVEGYAQCVGDLSPSDCTACLAESVGKLKNLCGSAVAAEVYLAQCYARYWGSGYYDFSSGQSIN
ncbi:secretory protein-like [Arabidopsis thaliana]|uniref:Plasmodesmata-located protein 8 n=1 Tax=Arabidopsis thaliana TaxID=3702 RepID=A0A1I9LQV5_ARATH|nr:plasmodesmata-located protein 8 [Arabidopsis thaliana]ANM64963.1 plasmodesmata-located protein 8 [Arabidopsis thaliana]CAB82676.1 secretory protein-like [Arabidopsis thaliana]|eukprot:NP_001326963.1 plasmodesmata-located protein 8 [Arabidopsis thaliana]